MLCVHSSISLPPSLPHEGMDRGKRKREGPPTEAPPFSTYPVIHTRCVCVSFLSLSLSNSGALDVDVVEEEGIH